MSISLITEYTVFNKKEGESLIKGYKSPYILKSTICYSYIYFNKFFIPIKYSICCFNYLLVITTIREQKEQIDAFLGKEYLLK